MSEVVEFDISAFLKETGLPESIKYLFDAMDVAEEEIEKAIKKYPDHRLAIWNGFILLNAPDQMYRLEPRMYRHHCQELLKRVVDGEDTRPGTTAECLIAMSNVAGMIPVKGYGLTVFSHLFVDVFGHHRFTELVGRDLDNMYQEWPTQVEEIIADIRHKIRNKDRKPKTARTVDCTGGLG